MPFYLVGILPTFPFCFETPFLFLTQYCELLPRNKPKLTHYIVIQLSCKISSVCLFCVCVCICIRIRIRIMMRQQYHLHRLLLDTDATLPPINRSKLSSSYAGSDTNFDSNMVIILAALLCALICALGLNSIVRCALRCSQRLAFENPDRTAARLATTGLKRDALSQIPVVVYMSGLDTPTTDCPICLGEFVEGEKVRILPKCNHGFHIKCIDTWLVSHSSCPTCRQLLSENPTSSNVVEGDGSV
ncbi:unnamed protein product [Camellia sinensis]